MKRKIGLFLVFGAALPLVAVSAAWACGVLTTVTLSTKVASPGQTITVTGKNYSSSASASPVAIRLKSRTGDILTTTVPDSANRISATVTLPASLSPGWYVVLATQTVNGLPKSGTPGRTTIRVQGAQSSAAAPGPWSSPPAPPAAGDGPLGGPALLALGGLLSLIMLASGWTLVGRAKRSVSTPQLGV
ncbi:MAG TPA: hypothetical protein VLH10_17395 [Yinghuangia sp.]|nr:hypothetical protein [Yinghuangia sp.]